ncbi:MAG: dethiobiotin synthetase [Abditibacteriota bacterium]|nr:dethiobiotin synthetase [Abditibacteriota bacterium]
MNPQSLNPQSLFITGTDTGVGKTMVTALLALHWRKLGFDVGVMKPFATGCSLACGELVCDDARWLKETVGLDDDLDLINPARWEEPLAPLVAARRAGDAHVDWIDRCRDALEVLRSRHEFMLVEGVGGLLVPLQERRGEIQFPTAADLANEIGFPLALVARRELGTINHTLLTVCYGLQVPLAGLVFCDSQPIDKDNIAAQTSPALICEMSGLPAWMEVPFLPELSRASIEAWATSQLVSG